MARVNRVTLPPVLGTAEDQQQEEREKDTPPREGLLQLLKYPTMVVRMLIIVLNWYWQSSQKDRQTDRQADRQTGGQTDRQAGRQTETERVVETGRQADRRADRQTQRQRE